MFAGIVPQPPDDLTDCTVTFRNLAGFLYVADVLRDDGAWLWLKYGYFNGEGKMLPGNVWMPKAACKFISAPKQTADIAVTATSAAH